jgi:deubiquitinase DESI2
MSSFGARRSTTKVYVNVYDLAPVNDCLHPIGLGMYHTGVEVLGSEYTFASQAGVFHHNPKEVPQATFREQIFMGEFDGGHTELKAIVDAIGGDQFGPNDYNILSRNCNHFASALCVKLVRKPTPAYINRLADIGNCLSCLIPKHFLQQAPVDKQSENQSMPFLLKTPMNRGGPVTLPKGTTVFSGAGTVLGGGSGRSTTSYFSSSSSSASATTSNDSLTDRREKARAAALARLELNNNSTNSVTSNDSNKSM